MPVFYGDSNRYFGVELEIDEAGKDDDYAEEILDVANEDDEHIYIKSDGGLEDGWNEMLKFSRRSEYAMNR